MTAKERTGRTARRKPTRSSQGTMVVDSSREMHLAAPEDRVIVNHRGDTPGPRFMLLDVEKNQWVPIRLSPGQYILRRTRPEDAARKPGTGRIILPPGYVPPTQ